MREIGKTKGELFLNFLVDASLSGRWLKTAIIQAFLNF